MIAAREAQVAAAMSDFAAELDLDVPVVEPAPGLSAIDEVMAALFQELRSEGTELK
ncbi:hypothetical protein ACFCYM_18950 [Streptomyces sp. NPDC056254]|uniref:hypothetical protein n=1 Tax=Streptomyces sp. NPDC056254 TaxID=3345763 RepID=UPI0035E064E9